MTKFDHFIPRTLTSLASKESEGLEHGSCPASGEENAGEGREVPGTGILMPVGLVLQVSESQAGTRCQAEVRVMSWGLGRL